MLWFKHDSDASTDAKLKKLIIRHGTDGYAIYFHCLELIMSDVSEKNITFVLEHDSEIIADNLKIRGDLNVSAIEKVEQIMITIIDLGLFERVDNHIRCLQLLKRMDVSMTSSPTFRRLIQQAKDTHISCQHHDTVMIPSCQTRQEKTRKEKNKEDALKLQVKISYDGFRNVFLTEKEYQTLITDYGHTNTLKILNCLDSYKESSGKKYKSDMGAIRSWVLDKLKLQKRQSAAGCPKCGLAPFVVVCKCGYAQGDEL